jgi:hypothetical protein
VFVDRAADGIDAARPIGEIRKVPIVGMLPFGEPEIVQE